MRNLRKDIEYPALVKFLLIDQWAHNEYELQELLAKSDRQVLQAAWVLVALAFILLVAILMSFK